MPRALSRASLSLENIDTDNIESLNVAEARVSIYSSRAKTTLLPNNPGTVQTANRPTFQINNLTDSDIAGYYVYFGTNINANPVSRGRYTRTAGFTTSIIRQKGIYYFIFKAKDRAGNISDAVITEYRYKK